MSIRNIIRTSAAIFCMGLSVAACGSTTNVATEAPEPSEPGSGEAAPAEPAASDGLLRCEDVPRLESPFTGTLGAAANADDRLMGVLFTYAQENRDTYAGRWIDRENGGVVVIAFTDDPEPHKAALLERGPLETDEVGIEPPPPITDPRPLGERDDFVFDVVQARYTEAELLKAQQTLHSEFTIPSLESSGLSTSRNIISVELIDPSVDELTTFTDATAGLPICVNIFVPPTPPEGPLDIIAEPGQPFELPAGLGEVEWELDPAFPSPTAEDTEIHVLATERGCASGREMGDALRGPQVLETDTEVVIAFAVELPLGGQECPGNPPTAVTVTLDQPLGDRELVNGAEQR